MKCPIECRETEILMELSSGKLEAGQVPQLAGHLENCEPCRAFVAEQRKVWSALDAWQTAPVSADFNRKLYQRIEQIDQHASWAERLFGPLRGLGVGRAIPLAASAAVILMAGALLQRTSAPPIQPVHDTAQMESLQPEQLETALDEMEALSQLSRPVHAEDSKM